ncbi:DDHD domain-containing protein [Phycomyces nitens]|nr:DDHD domain-containing protein [Phycomyces nitens]
MTTPPIITEIPLEPISDHLVIFIHGMGQQYEENGNIEHHVATMQKNTEEVLQTQFPTHRLRVKYVPVEWHSVVHLLVDTKMDQSSLSTVPKVRLATNHWLLDCMYYFTKPHNQCIIDTICDQSNKIYNDHLADHPDFKENQGQVHMVGFSLGGIAGYDIASSQWLPEDGLPPWDGVQDQKYVCARPDVKVPKLDFPIKSLFTCGSPIAAGLIFRGLDYMHFRPPSRTRVFNIFHPFDPLGYRLEPMINDDYSTIDPVKIQRAQRKALLSVNIPKIPDLGIRSSFAGAGPMITRAKRSFWRYINAEPKPATQINVSTTWVDDEDIAKHPTNSSDIAIEPSNIWLVDQPLPDMLTCSMEESGSDSESSATDCEPMSDIKQKEMELSSHIPGRDGNHYCRTDYVLSENVIDAYASEWIIAMKSHFRYWANRYVWCAWF